MTARRPPGPPFPPGTVGRGGFGTKVRLVTDGNRLPLAVALTGGQRQECTQLATALDAVRVSGRRGRTCAVAGDRGYSYRHIRRWLRRRGIRAVIPYRRDQRPDDRRYRFDPAVYRRRAGVGRCAGWLKEDRAVGTRFDKLAVNYLATVQLAVIRRYLRTLIAHADSADRT